MNQYGWISKISSKWEKPDRKHCMLFDCIYMKFLEKTNCRNRKISGCLGLGWEGGLVATEHVNGSIVPHQTVHLKGVNFMQIITQWSCLKIQLECPLPWQPSPCREGIPASLGARGLPCTSFSVWLLTPCSCLFVSKPICEAWEAEGASEPSLCPCCLVWKLEQFSMTSVLLNKSTLSSILFLIIDVIHRNYSQFYIFLFPINL